MLESAKKTASSAQPRTKQPADLQNKKNKTETMLTALFGKTAAERIVNDQDLIRALNTLSQRQVVFGGRSKKVSTRVDPGIMQAAKERFGLLNESDVINASLALAAAPDRFKEWLLDAEKPTLSEDFELAV
jgi:hypothetical protein